MANIVIRLSLFIICLAANFMSAPVTGAGEVKIDWDKLFAGDVLVEAVESKDGIPGVKASFCVEAGQDEIWEALTDYPSYPKIYKGLKKINVLEENESGAKVELFYSVNFLKIFRKDVHYVLDRRYTSAGREITWSRISGDLKRINGSWEIRDTARDGTYLLVHCTYVEPDGFVPAMLVRSGAMKEAPDMAQRLRAWIEKKIAGQD